MPTSSSSAKLYRVLRQVRRKAVSITRHLHPGALVLVLLVGFNLTITCQGHDANNRHFGPHVTFLFGLSHNMLPAAAWSGQESYSRTFPRMTDMPGMGELGYTSGTQYMPEAVPTFDVPGLSPAELFSLQKMAGLPVLNAGANVPALASAAQAVGEGLSTLGLALVTVPAPTINPVRWLEPATFDLRESQTALGPDSPPPRLSLLKPAA